MPLPITDGFASSHDTLLASAARTTSGQSPEVFARGPVTGLVIEVNVSALSGTSPSLTLDLEDTFDGSTWNKVADVDSAAITATGVTVKRVDLRGTPCTERLRVNYTIAGTSPSVTFSVKAYLVRI